MQKFAVNKLFKKIFKIIKKNKVETTLLLLSLIFSSWLMFSSFSYEDGSMLISTKSWSDFASHIPLIRSFSYGNNFLLPEYPLFSGEPIRYHFLFYLFSGLLEKMGLRIDYALNIPSIIGFLGLITIIYLLAKLIFKSKAVGVLSVLFFLFNGSLSFIYFLKNHLPFSNNILLDIVSNKNFSSFAPYYGDGIVSAFWNLNIYTNQRHLAFSYALSLFLIYILLKKILSNRKISLRLSVILGFILGISFLLNMAVFAMTLLITIFFLILFKKHRYSLLIFNITGAIIALPFYLYLQSGLSTSFFTVNPGYLIFYNLTFYSFFNYWFYNLGLHIFLIPLGFLIALKPQKKIFISFFILFILANFFQFSVEMAANHKFINFFMIAGVMFSSYFLIWLWNKKNIFKLIVLIFVFLLIFSGIVDFFPIYNDTKIKLADYPINKNVKWIINYTGKDAAFLNSSYLYTPSSLAGRKNFLGWPYFAWSQGYDTTKRDDIRKEILKSTNLNDICPKLKKYNLKYIEFIKNNDSKDFNYSFFDSNFKKVYENKLNQYYIYEVNNSCK